MTDQRQMSRDFVLRLRGVTEADVCAAIVGWLSGATDGSDENLAQVARGLIEGLEERRTLINLEKIHAEAMQRTEQAPHYSIYGPFLADPGEEDAVVVGDERSLDKK